MSIHSRKFTMIRALCLGTLLAAGQSFATTYYIDYAGGSDNNDGITPLTAWQHCPNDFVLLSGKNNTFINASSSFSPNWSHNLSTNCPHAYALVAVQSYYPTTPSSVTFGGTQLTQLATSLASDASSQIQFWGAPMGDLTGGSYPVAVATTSSGPGYFVGGAMIFQGVNQTNSIGTISTANTAAITLTIPPNGYGVAGLGIYSGTQDAIFGTSLLQQNNSGCKLTVTGSAQTGVQTFAFSCPGYPVGTIAMSLLTDTAAGPGISQLTYGDVVSFKGGVSYVLGGSITPINGVSYDSTWGIGKARFTDNNSNPGHVAFLAPTTLKDVVFRNLIFTNIGGISSYGLFPSSAYNGIGVAENDGYGFISSGSVSNAVFDGCDFYKLGYWSNAIPINAGSINGVGILMSSSAPGVFSGITITNCHFEDMAKAISITAGPVATNIAISHCSFTGTFNWVVALNFRGLAAYMDYLTIDHCTFGDFFALTGWHGYGGAPHIDGIYYFGSYDPGSETYMYGTNVFFYDNSFYSTGEGINGTIQAVGTTSPMTIDRGVSANVYNNTWSNCAFANGCISLGDGPNNPDPLWGARINIFNNTMIDHSGTLLITMGSSYSGRFSQKVNILNNVSYQSVAYTTLLRVSGQSTANYDYTYIKNNWYINYNCWAYPLNVNSQIYVYMNPWWNGSGFSDQRGNFHDLMRGSLGFELQSIFTLDPLLAGLAPQPNSPLIDAGTNLTAAYGWMPGLTSDKDGNPRPPLGPWTMGALSAFGSSSLPYVSLIATPSTINRGQSATLTWMSINATNMILSGIGPVGTDGSTTVSPTKNPANYVITATGENGTTTASVSVTVKPPPPVLFTPR